MFRRSPDLWPARYQQGMWAWLFQRACGVVIALYVVAHIIIISTARFQDGALFNRLMHALERPYIFALELPLGAVIIYHGLSGLRVMLLELGIGVRRPKAVFWGLLVAGIAIFIWGIILFLPYIRGRALT